MFRVHTIGLILVLVLSACGGQEAAETTDEQITDEEMAEEEMTDREMAEEEMTDGEMAEGEESFAFGHPAEAAEATRTIEVETSDDLVFHPPEVTVQQGETVTFAVTNPGNLEHDFVIGDEQAQEEHAHEMEAGEEEMEMEGMAHGGANAISIPAGETVELTWTFDGETEGILYGCHEDGHYEAGMVGSITVEPS